MADKKKIGKYKPMWYREACTHCGVESLSTRTQDNIPWEKEYVCDKCEMYKRGYKEGIEELHKYQQSLMELQKAQTMENENKVKKQWVVINRCGMEVCHELNTKEEALEYILQEADDPIDNYEIWETKQYKLGIYLEEK
jgi:hypothetical protein